MNGPRPRATLIIVSYPIVIDAALFLYNIIKNVKLKLNNVLCIGAVKHAFAAVLNNPFFDEATPAIKSPKQFDKLKNVIEENLNEIVLLLFKNSMYSTTSFVKK